jgi:hypothetical protein
MVDKMKREMKRIVISSFIAVLVTIIIFCCNTYADTCIAKYPAGKVVTVTATPCPGSRFVKWEGACTGVFPICTVKMTAHQTVNAVFELIPYPEHVRLIDLLIITPEQIGQCRDHNGFIKNL